MKFHPYAEIFPLIDDADFDQLVEDIKAHGLREPIWTFEGQILDGRNRFMACAAAKVKPQFREYTGGDALAFVLSLNVHRRHLTESQRAMAAAEVAKLSRGRPSQANESNGEKNRSPDLITQTEAAERMHVSPSSVKRAKQVLEKGSKELQRAVKSGELPVKKAAAVVDLPKSEQLKAAKQALPPRQPEALAPQVEDADEPERPDDIDEDAALAAAEQEFLASAQRALGTDAVTEIKRLAAELATVKTSRDSFMNGKAAITKLLQEEQRKVAKLERKLKEALAENDKLRERIAIMEAA
ncbi:MAG TPA: hypothetical protein VD932_03980 [Aquabacterium sp.]|nr:hypothetical protein [Aquabacterium sp.]